VTDKDNNMVSTSPLVLAVDDSAANLTFLHLVLQKQGYAVLLASNGQAALELALKTPPDLILLDVTMPHWDGYETCLQLKQQAVLKIFLFYFYPHMVMRPVV
jgi:CheY-like chemotaxis protein